MRTKIRLETHKDVINFVNIATKIDTPIYLTSNNLRVHGTSLLGAMYTLEWDEIWCECEKDIYHLIERFVV